MPAESLAVLRPSALGDFVFALPALRALRDTWPQARIVYLGRPWHAEFLAGRGVVDEVAALPALPGVTAPLGASEGAEAEGFFRELRARRFDVAFQLFGGGRYSNPVLRRLGARLCVGLQAPDAPPLDRSLPYVPLQNERLRLLEAVGLAGARTAELAPRLPLTGADEAALASRLALPEGPLAVLQPGARDPRRRWPAERFAAVGDALAQAGATVVVNGSEEERGLTASVVRAMQRPAIDAGGSLALGALAALLARARLVVSNDTGPLHLAQAVGAATVGIYWLTNLFVSGPLVAANHRHALSLRTRCPVCDTENIAARCAHDVCFVDDVSLEEVLDLALGLWRSRREASAPAPALPA